MDFDEGSSSVRSGGFDPQCETGRDCALYQVVVPEQNMVVRLNGLDSDTPEDDYLPAVRPYGLLRMAWAIWREVPDVSPKKSLSLALRIRREGQMEVLVTTRFLAEHVQGSLLARHRLAAHLECEGVGARKTT